MQIDVFVRQLPIRSNMKKSGWFELVKKATNLMIFFVIVFMFLFSCGESPEKAREKLAAMSIEYSEQSFLEKIRKGDVVVVKLFLIAGMNPNRRIYDGNSKNRKVPLIEAAFWGNYEMVKSLLDGGADINFIADDNMTALHAAGLNGSAKVIKLLLDKGANINAVDDRNYTALYHSASNIRVDAVKNLLERGADPYIACYWPHTGKKELPLDAAKTKLAIHTALSDKEKNQDFDSRKDWERHKKDSEKVVKMLSDAMHIK